MVKPLTIDANVSMTTTGTGNSAKVYGTYPSQDWRIYAANGGNVIISVVDGYELQSVKLTYTKQSGPTFDGPDSDVSAAVSGSSVTYSVSSAGHIRISAVEVKYVATSGGSSTKDDPTITFNNPTTTVNVGESITNVATITPNTLTVTYSSSDTNIATVDTSTGEVTGIAAGTATITASFAGNDDYNPASTSYELSVVDPNKVYYVKVTEAPTDWSGEYLLVCENSSKALAQFSTTSTVYGIGESVSPSSGKIESTSTVDAYRITVAPASGDNATGYTLKLNGAYVNWSSGNSLSSASAESDNARWITRVVRALHVTRIRQKAPTDMLQFNFISILTARPMPVSLLIILMP